MNWLSFVAIWKSVSIGLTGFFGMLALLTEYKNKLTNQVTKWGYVSLVGIVLSTCCGITAQVIDQRHSDDEAAMSAHKAAELAGNAQQAAKDAEASVHQIRRALTPIKDIYGLFFLDVPCETEAAYRRLCQRVQADLAAKPTDDHIYRPTYARQLPWPDGKPGVPKVDLTIWEKHQGSNPLAFFVNDSKPTHPTFLRLEEVYRSRKIRFILSVPLEIGSNLAGVKSMLDVEGTRASVSVKDPAFAHLSLSGFAISDLDQELIEGAPDRDDELRSGSPVQGMFYLGNLRTTVTHPGH